MASDPTPTDPTPSGRATPEDAADPDTASGSEPRPEPASRAVAGPGGWKDRLRRLGSAARGRVATAWAWLQPGPEARRGAAWGTAIAALAVGGFLGTEVRSGLPRVVDVLLLAALAGGVVAAVAWTARLTRWLLGTLPRFVGWAGLGLAVVVHLVFTGRFPPLPAVLLTVGCVAVAAGIGGVVGWAASGGLARAGWGRRVVALAVLVAALGLGTWGALRLASDGDSEHLRPAPPTPEGLSAAALVAAAAQEAEGVAEPGHPGEAGPHGVIRLTYGPGTDRHRPEYGPPAGDGEGEGGDENGSGVDLVAPTVDGTPFTKGYDEGWRRSLRDDFWGFGLDEMPLAGRAWLPDGAGGPGPYPLVLVVHGNHSMADFSDAGYAWLGEHLASRGLVTVSVDENFLNGSFLGGVPKENDARGWLLLEHARLLERWSGEEGNPFHGAVDPERLVLVGHSRGGEAAAHAALFSRLPAWPDDATVRFDYRPVRAVVALAPTDRQYEPGDRPTALEGTSYLVLHGGHDGDVSLFLGDRQYRRVAVAAPGEQGTSTAPAPTPPPFKASVHLYRANHGQFNTTWGRHDGSPPYAWLLATEAIMDPDDQIAAGRVLITAFVEAALGIEPRYRALFRGLARGGAWLPEGVYRSRSEDVSWRTVADFGEDWDVTTATVPGATIEARGLALWREGDVDLRKGRSRGATVAWLGWRTPEPEEDSGELTGGGTAGEGTAEEGVAGQGAPRWGLELPEGRAAAWGLGAADRLVLELARAPGEPPERDGDDEAEEDGEAAGEGETAEFEGDDARNDDSRNDDARKDDARKDDDKDEEPVDLTVELEDGDGTVARRPLGDFGPLLVTLPARLAKPEAFEGQRYGTAPEPVFHGYELPLAAFVEAEPEFDPTTLRAVRLVFDRGGTAIVVLDRVGFAGPPR